MQLGTPRVGPGQWDPSHGLGCSIEPPISLHLSIPGVALNWFVEFPDGAERNGVTLPAGPLFFTGACWDAN